MTTARPRDGAMMFIRHLMVVDLPAPLAPIRAKALPCGIVILRPRSASKRPYFFQTLSTSIIIFRTLPEFCRVCSNGRQDHPPRRGGSAPAVSLPRQVAPARAEAAAFCRPASLAGAQPPPCRRRDELRAIAPE